MVSMFLSALIELPLATCDKYNRGTEFYLTFKYPYVACGHHIGQCRPKAFLLLKRNDFPGGLVVRTWFYLS